MIFLQINGIPYTFSGNSEVSLLAYLRNELFITSAKDGCSGQGVCGACTVEINGMAKLACRVKMKDLADAAVITTEGLPEKLRLIIGKAFANQGAVQCGFCTPGFIMRMKSLIHTKPHATRQEIIKVVSPNLCRCTGYVKIVDSIEAVLHEMNNTQQTDHEIITAKIGERFPKYQSIETALGNRKFVDDMHFDGMLHAVLKFSDYPRAVVKKIDVTHAKNYPGVKTVLTATDIPGDKYTGLIFPDWPLMVGMGETTHYIGDVVAMVVADNEAIAREACKRIEVVYEVLEPVTDVHAALQPNAPNVHAKCPNLLERCKIKFGDSEKAFQSAAFVSAGIYETQRIEHAFLETETAIALPEAGGIKLFSQGQGVYVDQQWIAKILRLPIEQVRVVQVENGGGFGGKEDMTVQGHAALAAYLLQQPVRVHLSREESMLMHPKRHPVWMDMHLACDANGKFTAITLRAVGDSGAYASVGTKVMERVVGHATSGYTIPVVDIQADTVYTNNIPCGAMRGFGVPQVVFAIEGCIDDLCRQGGFDRWQIRFDNALDEGSTTATGQRLQGVGLKKTLLAVKEQFRQARFAGIACGIKNTGVGNGMVDESEVCIQIISKSEVLLQHGWSEMGQGVHTMAIQTLHHETGINPEFIRVEVDTKANLPTGMTTSSRATALVANAIMDAAKDLQNDLKTNRLENLIGKNYKGKYVCDFTCKPDAGVADPTIHFAYGYATQVVILDDTGNIRKVIAAHDAGKIMNRMLFEGQIEGAVHMGLGYALTEDFALKDGKPISLKLKDVGMLRANEMPEIEVIGIEESDQYGPYGAKGIGEIGLVPTAAAVVNALNFFDGKRRMKLPVLREVKSKLC